MAKYFTIPELSASATAVKLGIDNTPPPDVRVKLTTLINNCLDPIREMWGKPIHVNSGFRCPTLNKAVGGATSSQHMTGEAADITAGSPAKNKELFDMIVKSGIEFDQLIAEGHKEGMPYKWLHVSYRAGNNRKNILYL